MPTTRHTPSSATLTPTTSQAARLHGISTDTVMGHHGVGIFWNVREWTLDCTVPTLTNPLKPIQRRRPRDERPLALRAHLRTCTMATSVRASESSRQLPHPARHSAGGAGRGPDPAALARCWPSSENPAAAKARCRKAIMRLLPDNAEHRREESLVNGTDIAPYPEKQLQKLRGRLFLHGLSGPHDRAQPQHDDRRADCRSGAGPRAEDLPRCAARARAGADGAGRHRPAQARA